MKPTDSFNDSSSNPFPCTELMQGTHKISTRNSYIVYFKQRRQRKYKGTEHLGSRLCLGKDDSARK